MFSRTLEQHQAPLLHHVAPINFNSIATLSSTDAPISSLIILQNKQLASGHSDKKIRIWNLSSHKCIATLSGHTNEITTLAVSQNNCLISGSRDATIRTWNVNTGKCLLILKGHTSFVFVLMILKNDLLASGANDKTIRLWSLQTGVCLSKIQTNTAVQALSVLNNHRLASGGHNSNIVLLWDLFSTNQNQYVSKLTNPDNEAGVTDIQALQKRDHLAIGYLDTMIRLWKVNNGNYQRIATLSGHTAFPYVLTVLQDGRLVSGGWDNIIRVWNISDNQNECVANLSEHTDYIIALTVLQNGHLVSAAFDNTIRVWDMGLRPVSVEEQNIQVSTPVHVFQGLQSCFSFFSRILTCCCNSPEREEYIELH